MRWVPKAAPSFGTLSRWPEKSDRHCGTATDNACARSIRGCHNDLADCLCLVLLAVDDHEPEVQRLLGHYGAVQHGSEDRFAGDNDDIFG